MENDGIVSTMDSSGSRKVLVTADAMKAAGQALRELDETAKADGTTITIEHQGEVLATLGKEQA
mgnify:FL=1